MSRVYVLYTGGTIGSAGDPLAPMPKAEFERLVLSMPGLENGRVRGADAVQFVMDAYETALDSSNMTPSDWVRMARSILAVYDEYDGFCILHGTDTMAWSASALSFLLRGLTKPVVFTGAQVPLAEPRSDALRNLITSIQIAGTAQIPEVCLFFDDRLLRGNRALKVHASQFHAFDSPNYPPLGIAGTDIAIDFSRVLPMPPAALSLGVPENLRARRALLGSPRAAFDRFSVIHLLLFPGIPASMIHAIVRDTVPPLKGIVLESFGEGNAPTSPEFLNALAAAHDAGVVIVGGTQAYAGMVKLGAYETGSALKRAGAVSAYDMTNQAALTKLICQLGLGGDQAEVEWQMGINLCGEMTVP